MSDDEFEEAMSGLIAKGLAEELINEDGQLCYILTEKGKQYVEALNKKQLH